MMSADDVHTYFQPTKQQLSSMASDTSTGGAALGEQNGRHSRVLQRRDGTLSF